MTKSTCAILFATAGTLAFGRQGLAASPSADDIVLRHLKARGGLSQVRKVAAYEFWGHIVSGKESETTHGSWERPNKLRIDRGGADWRVIYAYDGERTWTIETTPWGDEPSAMVPSMADVFIREANFEGPLANYKAENGSLSVSDRALDDTTNVYELTLTAPGGKSTNFEVDAISWLLHSQSYYAGPSEFSYRLEIQYADYREVGGIKFPFRLERRVEGGYYDEVVIDSIKIVADIPDSLFVAPPTPAQSADTGAVTDLDRIIPLRDSFTADAGAVRLIALLSPT